MPRKHDIQPRKIQCAHCQNQFSNQTHGTQHRNHCPFCLWSLHLDDVPGDRDARCGGQMKPIAVSVKPNGEWLLIHQCRQCGTLHSNRIACDDSEVLLLSLALRPLALPAFPLEQVTTPPGYG